VVVHVNVNLVRLADDPRTANGDHIGSPPADMNEDHYDLDKTIFS
jgi:hypothetical protein